MATKITTKIMTKIGWISLRTGTVLALMVCAGPVMGQEVARFGQLSALGGFLPSLSLGYSYNNSSSGRLDPTGQSITRTNYSAQLTGGIDLFRGFRRFSDLRGAQLGVEASSARYRETEY